MVTNPMPDLPLVDRPYMPGYGLRPADQGMGLLPWEWVEQRLAGSHDYWLATTRPDGQPHLMPVWAVWLDKALWFSCSNGSRKTRNLRAEPRCTLATDNPRQLVVAEGPAEVVADRASLGRMLEAENAKYRTDYGLDMLDPAANTCFKVHPSWVFGLDGADFTGSPTRYRFRPPAD